MTDFELFQYAESHGFGEIHCNVDSENQVQQVIAIHSTKLGPALGGCRCVPYASSMDAIYDAMRLARGMSFKSAMVGLPFGGGKCVVMRPPEIRDRQKYFQSIGRFVDQLNGRYITAIDSGTSVYDMDIIHTVTPHVTCLSTSDGDTSLFTARGVANGIKAALTYKLKRDNFDGIHVAIQGVGNVGFYLAEILHQQGVKLTVSDVNQVALNACAEKFGATIVPPDSIYDVECDVFAPCALGAIINKQTIARLKAPIIAGSANNQLAHSVDGQLLHERGILYCPDYVINAGGLIFAASHYLNYSQDQVTQKLANIYNTLLDVFERSAKENRPSNQIADAIAAEKL